MPTVIDNIQIKLLDQLNLFINHATQLKTCIGYLNVKGWSALGKLINSLPPNPTDPPCRVLLGMIQPQAGLDPALVESSPPDGEHLRAALGAVIDDVKAQITRGVPTKSAQEALRLLAAQIRAGVVRVKVYLCHPLHAKLYLLRRSDPIAPQTGVDDADLVGLLAALDAAGELVVVSQPSEARVEILCTMGLKTP